MIDYFRPLWTTPPPHGVVEKEPGIRSHNTDDELDGWYSTESYMIEARVRVMSNPTLQLGKITWRTPLENKSRMREETRRTFKHKTSHLMTRIQRITDTIRGLEPGLQKCQVGDGPCLLSQDRSEKRDVTSTETSQFVSDEDFEVTENAHSLCFQDIEALKGTLLDSPSDSPQPKWSSTRIGSHLALNRHDPSHLALASSLRLRYKTRIIVATTGLCLVSSLPLIAAQGPLAAGFRVASGVTSLGIGMAVLPLNAAEQVPGLAVILLYVAWAMCFVLYFWLQNQVIEDSSNYKRKLYAVAVGVSGVIITIIFSHVFNQMNNGFAFYAPIVFTATAYVASLFFGTEKRDVPAGLSDSEVGGIELQETTQPTVAGAERT